jgi:integrase
MVNGHELVESVKTDAGHRTLPLDPVAAAILERRRVEAFKQGHASPKNPIFANRYGGYTTHGYYRRTIWTAALKSAGIDYRVPYTLRHTAASWMLNSGQVGLPCVSRWLGHANIETTLDITPI